MAFEQLINVYEMPVWIFIIATVIILVALWLILTLSSTAVTKNTFSESVLTKIFSLLKVLLEQGDPLPNDTFAHHERGKSVKILLIGFLFMAVVLSDGYKNANVYKMITPRRQLRYETFSDLLKDNLSVHTFSGGIQQKILYSGWNVSDFLSENIHMEYSIDQCEITYFLRYLENMGRFQVPLNLPKPFVRGLISDEVKLNELVFNKTKFFPVNFMMEWQKWFKSRYPSWRNMAAELFLGPIESLSHTDYQHLEKQAIFKSLGLCNKTALVVKSSEASNYAKLLTHGRESTGKETYFRHLILFQVRGFVSPHFLLRLARLKESGIVKHWENITGYISNIKSQSDTPRNETPIRNERPVKTSMPGNIVIIFCLLGVGLILGSVWMIVENVSAYGQKLVLAGCFTSVFSCTERRSKQHGTQSVIRVDITSNVNT